MVKTIIEDKKLKNLIRWEVMAVMQELLSDPDFGLELRQEFIRRLKKSIESKRAGRLVPFEEIKKRYKNN